MSKWLLLHSCFTRERMTSTRKHDVNDRRHSHLIVRLASHDQNDHDSCIAKEWLRRRLHCQKKAVQPSQSTWNYGGGRYGSLSTA
jgi:hypothetical protein